MRRLRSDIEWGLLTIFKAAVTIAAFAILILLVSGDAEAELGFSIWWVLVYYAGMAAIVGTAVGVVRPWLRRLPVLLILGIGASVLSFFVLGLIKLGTDFTSWDSGVRVGMLVLSVLAGIVYGVVAWYYLARQ